MADRRGESWIDINQYHGVNMKKLIGAALAVGGLVAGSVNAAIDDGSSSLLGNGELFITLFDEGRRRSVVVDLGINYNDMIGSGIDSNLPIYLDLSRVITTVFGNDTANVRWNIAGKGDSGFTENPPETDFRRYGSLFSGVAPATYDPTPYDIHNFSTAINELLVYTADNINGDFSLWDPAYSSKRAINNYYDGNAMRVDGVYWGRNARYLPWDSTQVGSGLLAMTWIHFSDAEGSAVELHRLGDWRLNMETGQLDYPAMPVPAAAWLLVSGIVGLSAFARRRKQA